MKTIEEVIEQAKDDYNSWVSKKYFVEGAKKLKYNDLRGIFYNKLRSVVNSCPNEFRHSIHYKWERTIRVEHLVCEFSSFGYLDKIAIVRDARCMSKQEINFVKQIQQHTLQENTITTPDWQMEETFESLINNINKFKV